MPHAFPTVSPWPAGNSARRAMFHDTTSLVSPRTLNMLYASKVVQYFLYKNPALEHVLSDKQKGYATQTDPAARCSLQEWHALLDVCTRGGAGEDPVLHLAAQLKPWCFGMLGPLFLSGATIGGLIDLMVQLHPLLNDVFDVERGMRGHRAFFRLRQATHEGSGRLARLSLLHWAQLMRFFTDRWDLVADASFEGPPPLDVLPYRRLFGGTVRFDQDETALFFDPAYLAIPVAYKDEALHRLLKGEAMHLMARSTSGQGLFADRLRSLVRSHLETRADQKKIAAAMSLTTRALQRRIQEAGIDFRAMVDEEKKREAIRLLMDTQMSVVELAACVGFADHASFSRAFKRWTSMSPSEYRATKARH